MRIHLLLTRNTHPVSYNYQPYLVGCLHKWLGENTLHDATSLYSFSWLKNGRARKNGLDFSPGYNWFISCYDQTVLKRLIQGIQESPEINFGLSVKEIMIEATPEFAESHVFKVASPVFIKRSTGKTSRFYFYTDAEADTLLTETLQTKLKKAGLPADGVEVSFDKTYGSPLIKSINYNGIFNKGSICPVIVRGTPEQVAFAWNVGVGNSTGIGFGALI